MDIKKFIRKYKYIYRDKSLSLCSKKKKIDNEGKNN